MSSYPPNNPPQLPGDSFGVPPNGATPTQEPVAPPTQPQRRPAGSLIQLSDNEARRVLAKISGDYSDAWRDNEQRIERFRRHYRTWRSKIGLAGGAQGKGNFRVPLIVEKVLIKWAKTLDSLLGDDAEIIAEPTGPVDQMVMHKVSRYMTWQVFNHMDIVEELAKFIFQEIIFGRAHAECYYDQRYLYGPGDKRQLSYDGPCFKVIPVDAFIVPPSAGECTPQDFAWVCTREWKTLDQLLVDEAEGYYEGISDNAKRIADAACNTNQFSDQTERLRREQAAFEGVVSDYAATDRNRIEVRKHYCRWRPLKGRRDADYDDYTARALREAEWCVTYLPDLTVNTGGGGGGLIIGVVDQAEIYPNTPNRRPIVTSALFKDGSYWPPGLPELLEDIEIEKSVNHNLMNQAGELAVSPPGFYIPGMGMNEERTKIEPGMLYASADPKAISWMESHGDYNFCVIRDQMLSAMAEGVSGLTAASVGRSPDQPNAPRTFRGQALLAGASDVRQRLEMIFMSDDWSKILDHIKMLVDEYGPPEEEFRVTEEKASGYFETHQGFATITAAERQGKYDFKLKFATSQQSREARKERELAFGQVAASLPLFIQNTNLQRDYLRVVARDLELDGLLPSLSMVPDQNVPLDPQTEWSMALQGIEPRIHPQDDDEAHLADHYQRIKEEQALPPERQDKAAIFTMMAHMMEHEAQKRQKMQMMAQAQAQANVQAALGMMGGGGGGGVPPQLGGAGGGPPQLGAGGGAAAQLAGALGGSPTNSGPSAGQQAAGFPNDLSQAEMTGGMQ